MMTIQLGSVLGRLKKQHSCKAMDIANIPNSDYYSLRDQHTNSLYGHLIEIIYTEGSSSLIMADKRINRPLHYAMDTLDIVSSTYDTNLTLNGAGGTQISEGILDNNLSVIGMPVNDPSNSFWVNTDWSWIMVTYGNRTGVGISNLTQNDRGWVVGWTIPVFPPIMMLTGTLVTNPNLKMLTGTLVTK